MSWLLFLDESGHDHKQMPYEVRGGAALHASALWPFTRAVEVLERDAFGGRLHEFGNELKGSSLLDRKRWKHYRQDAALSDEARRAGAEAFLRRGAENAARKKKGAALSSPTRTEFSAYGQACKRMADGLFDLLRDADARLFASIIPRGTGRAGGDELRGDQAALFGAYEAMLAEEDETGLLVMDEVTREVDRSFAARLDRHFDRIGAAGSRRVVPAPLFVNSASAHAVQAADLCIYCVNWGYRCEAVGMTAEGRPEIAENYASAIDGLFWRDRNRRPDLPPTGLIYRPVPGA